MPLKGLGGFPPRHALPEAVPAGATKDALQYCQEVIMSHSFVLCLGLFAALFMSSGCSGESEAQAEGANVGERIGDSLGAAYEEVVTEIPELSGYQVKRDFLLANYSTDTLQKKYIEISATNEADKLFYFEGAPGDSELDEKENLKRWSQVGDSLKAKYRQLGLNYDLYVSLNLLAIDEGWNLKFEDLIAARAAEINTERK